MFEAASEEIFGGRFRFHQSSVQKRRVAFEHKVAAGGGVTEIEAWEKQKRVADFA